MFMCIEIGGGGRNGAHLINDKVWVAILFLILTKKGSGNRAGSSNRARERSTQIKK